MALMQSNRSFLEKYLKKFSLGFIILFALFSGALFLFASISHEVLWEQEEELDHSVFKFLSANVISQDLTGLMKTVTNFASETFLQIAYGILALVYLFKKNWKRALEIVAIGVGGSVINYFMKLSFRRPRPPHPLVDGLENFSFPSGHATSAFIFYGLLAYLVWKTSMRKSYKYIIGFTFLAFALLIGFSRVYLRVHYPTDVMAGFCVGFAWLLLTGWLFERLKKNNGAGNRNGREQTS